MKMSTKLLELDPDKVNGCIDSANDVWRLVYASIWYGESTISGWQGVVA
jgi:hypothetical protein